MIQYSDVNVVVLSTSYQGQSPQGGCAPAALPLRLSAKFSASGPNSRGGNDHSCKASKVLGRYLRLKKRDVCHLHRKSNESQTRDHIPGRYCITRLILKR